MRHICRWIASLVYALAAASAQIANSQERTPDYDIIIDGGMIYDGSGGMPVRADLGIVNDRIAHIGDLRTATAKNRISAEGMAVAPGFINMLSWSAETLLMDGRASSAVLQGVTLEVMGEGTSWGPINARVRNSIDQAKEYDYEVDWTSLGEFLEKLERWGVSVNVASFVGSGTLRTHAVGLENRPASPEELAAMKRLAAEAMREGAMGLGSALIYAPDSFSSTAELSEIAGAVAPYGGMFIAHIRDEGDNLLPAVQELVAIVGEHGMRGEVHHLKAAGKANWPVMQDVFALIEDARASGVPITANMYTYTAGASGLDAAIPAWAQAGGLDAWIARLKDPALRPRIAEEMKTGSAGGTIYHQAGSPENILILGLRNPELAHLNGKSLGEIAREMGTSPEDAAMDLVIADRSRVGTVYFMMSEDNVKAQIKKPWVSFGSDGEALSAEGEFLEKSTHPRSYGNFARLLGKYVRDEQIIPLAEAIYRLTGLPSSNLQLRERGLIRPGFFADVVVFDPATIMDHATFENPHQYSTGVIHVLVNGVQVVAEGAHTGERPGRFVRGPGWTGWHAKDIADVPEQSNRR